MTKGGVFIVSAEPSGDALSVGLTRALRDLAPGLPLHAIGGSAVEAEGFASPIDTAPLAVLGFIEGVRALPTVNRLVHRAAGAILQAEPDLVVLIDSWGFSIRLARALLLGDDRGRKLQRRQIVKYVAPQVWAMRPGRARVLAQSVGHLLALHPFDAQHFEPHGLPTAHIGNPVLDIDHASGDGPAFRARHHIAMTDPLLLVAFGSRAAEIDRLTEPFLETVRQLRAQHPRLSVVAPTHPATRAQLHARLALANSNIILVDETEKRDAYAAADIALAKSGTVTTELADAGVPTAVAYRVSPVTYWLARPIFRAKYISLVNVTANAPLMPEFVQHHLVPDRIAAQLHTWLSDPKAAKSLARALRATAAQMRGRQGNASERAAHEVLDILG